MGFRCGRTKIDVWHWEMVLCLESAFTLLDMNDPCEVIKLVGDLVVVSKKAKPTKEYLYILARVRSRVVFPHKI